MAIAAGNIIDDADMADRFYSYGITAPAGSASNPAVSYQDFTNSGNLFYCYSNVANTHKGFGIAYESSGWKLKEIAAVASGTGTITVSMSVVNSKARISIANGTGTRAHLFFIWTPVTES